MDVVQVTPGAVYPPSRGGQHRMHGLVLGRREGDRIDRLVHALVPIDRSRVIQVDDAYLEYRTRSLLQYAASFLTSRVVDAPPVLASATMRVARTPRLDYLLGEADVILVERPWQFEYVHERKPEGTPIVYSSHNYEPELCDVRRGRLRRPVRRRVTAAERFAVREADLTVVTSERDRRSYAALAREAGPFHLAPNATYHTPGPEGNARSADLPVPDRAFVVLFVGSDHGPNVTAVRSLAEIATDEAVRGEPICFVVAGTVAGAVGDLPENVRALGFVGDLGPLYDRADLAINPVTEGAGSNVKVPEYFGRGVPVLTTRFGARGVPAEPGRHYLESPIEEMSTTVRALYDRPDGLSEVARNARRLVERELNWETVSEETFERLRELVP